MCSGQCLDGLLTFEKVSGHFLRTAQQVGLSMMAAPGITIECGGQCLQVGSDCPAFALDYVSQKCFKLDRNTQVELHIHETNPHTVETEDIWFMGSYLFWVRTKLTYYHGQKFSIVTI